MYAYQQPENTCGRGTFPGIGNANESSHPELPSVIKRLEQALTQLQNLAEAMDNRMTGVVARSQAPSPTTGVQGEGKSAMRTSFGAELEGMNERAIAITERLADLMERLAF